MAIGISEKVRFIKKKKKFFEMSIMLLHLADQRLKLYEYIEIFHRSPPKKCMTYKNVKLNN